MSTLGRGMQLSAESSATASIQLLWPFLALARKGGYRVDRLVRERLGLSEAQLADPETRVPQAQLAQLLHEAIAVSGERDIGLQAARYVDNLGISDYVARARPTLRSAFESNARYLPLLGDDLHRSLEIKGKLAVWHVAFSPALVVHEAAYEFVVALGVLMARRISGNPELAPLEVQFMHPRPASTRRHEKVFRCKLRFDAPATQVIMSAKALETRSAAADPGLGNLLEQQAEAMLQRLPRAQDLAGRVRALLRSERDLASASAPRIARRLGTSVRTLSRRLRDERVSYRDLLDSARRQVALNELASGTRPITEIALALGFASSQSFHRAFRRWTGTTAERYRKTARAQR